MVHGPMVIVATSKHIFLPISMADTTFVIRILEYGGSVLGPEMHNLN
jgi:hypothetical protein